METTKPTTTESRGGARAPARVGATSGAGVAPGDPPRLETSSGSAGGETRRPLTVPEIVASKGGRRLVMVTATDEPSARWVDRAGVDMVLVGDSLGMAALGRPDTLAVTMDEMVHHTRAAAAGCTRALLIGDMPFGSYQVSVAEAVRNAVRLVAEGGARAVKLEGPRPEEVAAIAAAGIPVVGHVGLTPQSVHRLGGYRVQGKNAAAARTLVRHAQELEAAGAFLIVIEGVPAVVGAAITRGVSVPTVGIGAGPECDGQVLVFADLLGLSDDPTPRFVRRYARLGDVIRDAVAAFADDVRAGRYPSETESYQAPADLAARLRPGVKEA
jgi:3-methyl-2-oxobutanoate hydroxymethyltransferase